MKRRFEALVLAVILLVTLALGSGPVTAWAAEAGISGTYYFNGETGSGQEFLFRSDFTGVQKSGSISLPFTYTVSGNTITATQDSNSKVYEITILDAYRIEYKVYGLPLIYIKVGDAASLERGPDEAWIDWWNRLPASEQQRLLEEDMALQQQMANAQKPAETEKSDSAAAAKAAKPITLKVNGVTVATDSPPVIENGRTLAPVRAIVEALGYIVSWDSATQTVDIYDPETGDLRISLVIGSKKAKVSTGIYMVMDERTLDVPAKIINSRTMVPVRFIAETLGCSVSWDEGTRTVIIFQNAG